jgi:hypothetical protein
MSATVLVGVIVFVGVTGGLAVFEGVMDGAVKVTAT